MAFFALAWSVAVAAATALPAWGFGIGAAWFCQTSILSLGAVKLTPLMITPAAVVEKRAPLGEGQQFGLVFLYTIMGGGLGVIVFRRRPALRSAPGPERAVAV